MAHAVNGGAWSATNAPSFLSHGLLDRFDQLTGLKGLAQKGDATGVERLLADGLVFEGGHEDDRKLGSGTLEPPPQFTPRGSDGGSSLGTLMALTCRITIHSDRIDIALSHGRMAAMLAGASIDLAAQPQIAVSAPDDLMTLRAPARLQRIGRGMRMIVEGVNDKAEADPSLLRVLTRAHNIQDRLSQDTDLTVHDVAREERVTAAYIYALLRLPWLAPDITTAIVNGCQPLQLRAKTLMRRSSRLPADWAEQRALLGF
ncbi:MAG TPA: hypothetical protein VKE72_09015 [Methylocella sp.]|nr:hypothetical protein [Methylocella sp.]